MCKTLFIPLGSDRAPNTGLIGQAPSCISTTLKTKCIWGMGVFCAAHATVCANDVLKLVHVLHFVKFGYRPHAIQWEDSKLVAELNRSTLPSLGWRCSSATLCSPPWDYGERKMPARLS